MKRITKYVALILIFALSGLTAFSFICYAETEVKGKEYYVELAENDPYELAENDPYIVLKRVNNYKDQPWAQEVIEAAAEKNPTAALQFANRYKEKPYAQKIIETAAEKRPQAALLFADYYMDQPYAQKIIETAAEKEPFAVLVCADRYVDQHWALKVVEEAIESIAENDPRRIPLMMLLPSLLQESKKPLIKTVLAIYEHFRYVKSLPNHGYLPFKAVRMFGMLEEMVSKNMTVEEAVNIVCDDKKFFRTLLKIKSKPNHLGRVAVDEELKKVALRRVRMIDDLHNEPDRIRFESVKGTDSQELYTLMVYGEEEILTSSFNGLFDRLLRAMKREEIGGDRILEDLGYNKFRVFIKLCTGFNRLNEFLETMDDNSQQILLERFIKGIDKEKDSLEQAVVIADTFSTVEDKEILKVLQETIKEEYERVKLEESKEGKILYGLLAGMFGEKAVINEAWIKEMAEKYQLPDLTTIPSEELFNRSGLNTQWYFFYNDKDGRASFWNFLYRYRGKSGWKIKDKESFILIESVGGDRKIEIYANKPEADKTGPKEIAEALKERNIQPVVVVHRGHSYHVQKTIGRIPSNVMIVSLGSCGGYNNINAVLRRASEAHIISTKRRGTMLVNDPLLKMLNDEMLSGKDIYWPEFWQKVEKRLGSIKDFRNYISPHKNLGVLFLKAYHRLVHT